MCTITHQLVRRHFGLPSRREQCFCDDSTADSDELQKSLEFSATRQSRLVSAGIYNTPATTLTVIAMMITLKKNATMLCSITTRLNGDDVIATSEV